MIFILTNLFTTLQCQRTTIRDKLTFVEAALWRVELIPNYIEVVGEKLLNFITY